MTDKNNNLNFYVNEYIKLISLISETGIIFKSSKFDKIKFFSIVSEYIKNDKFNNIINSLNQIKEDNYFEIYKKILSEIINVGGSSLSFEKIISNLNESDIKNNVKYLALKEISKIRESLTASNEELIKTIINFNRNDKNVLIKLGFKKTLVKLGLVGLIMSNVVTPSLANSDDFLIKYINMSQLNVTNNFKSKEINFLKNFQKFDKIIEVYNKYDKEYKYESNYGLENYTLKKQKIQVIFIDFFNNFNKKEIVLINKILKTKPNICNLLLDHALFKQNHTRLLKFLEKYKNVILNKISNKMIMKLVNLINLTKTDDLNFIDIMRLHKFFWFEFGSLVKNNK